MASTSLRRQVDALRNASSGTSSGYIQRKKGRASLLLTPDQVREVLEYLVWYRMLLLIDAVTPSVHSGIYLVHRYSYVGRGTECPRYAITSGSRSMVWLRRVWAYSYV